MASVFTMMQTTFRTKAFDVLSQAKRQRTDKSLNTISKPHEVLSAADGPTASVPPNLSTRPTGSFSPLPPNTRRFGCFKGLRWALRWRSAGSSFLLLGLLAACLSYAVPVPTYARSSATEVVLMFFSGTSVPIIDRLVRSSQLLDWLNLKSFSWYCVLNVGPTDRRPRPNGSYAVRAACARVLCGYHLRHRLQSIIPDGSSGTHTKLCFNRWAAYMINYLFDDFSRVWRASTACAFASTFLRARQTRRGPAFCTFTAAAGPSWVPVCHMPTHWNSCKYTRKVLVHHNVNCWETWHDNDGNAQRPMNARRA